MDCQLVNIIGYMHISRLKWHKSDFLHSSDSDQVQVQVALLSFQLYNYTIQVHSYMKQHSSRINTGTQAQNNTIYTDNTVQ